MDTVAIKGQLHEYIERADNKHLEAIYVLLEKEITPPHEYDAATLEMLYRRRENDLQGLSKSYTMEEAIEAGKVTKPKIKKPHKKGEHKLSYSPEFIVINGRRYNFYNPLRCSLEKETDHYKIQNENLDIYAVGKTEEEAIMDFKDEFDHLYQTLNSLTDDKIASRLKKIKTFIIQYVVKDVYEN